MALKNLFDMVKADRYTQDGREAIIKAQEAETEDATRRTYQIGEISQATGLQKTANGWVKPKNGKQPGAASKHDTDPQTYIVKKNDELRKMYLNEKDPAKKEAMKKALKKQASMMEPEPFSSTESKPAAGSKPVDKEKLLDTLSFDLVDTTADIEEEYNAVEHSDNSRLPEFVRQEIERDYVNKANGEKWSDAEKDIIAEEVTRRIKERQSNDSAPSLSEIVDRVYNIGEISEKTGLQKTANGWRPVKKGAAGKTSRASKEEAIRKDLGLTAGEDMSRFSDEQIEKMYAKTQQTPEQQKADFDKSKIGQAVNKGRQEFAAEKTRQKELASKTNAIGLPKESKPSADWKETPSGRTNMIRTPEGTATVTWNKEANGEEWYGFSTVKNNKMNSSDTHYKTKAEAQLAAEKELKGENEPAGRNFRSELEANPKGAYDFEKTIEHSIPLSAGDKEILGRVKSFMQEESTDYKNALKSVATGLVNGNKLRGDWYPEKEKSLLKIAKAVGMDNEVKSYVKTLAKGYDFGYSEDSAPRVLTGDCRIRIRKEKPALTGDTKIRVRK